MNENTKCSKCGSEDIKKIITSASFAAAGENSKLVSGGIPIFECNKCGYKFNDFLDNYCD